MKLRKPVIITPRLLPGVKVDSSFISIEYAGEESSGRTVYRWFVDIPAGEFSGEDLKSGCQGGRLEDGLKSLLCFLGAAGESYWYGLHSGQPEENEELFPAEVTEWAYQNEDEITMLGIELEESEGLIVE